MRIFAAGATALLSCAFVMATVPGAPEAGAEDEQAMMERLSTARIFFGHQSVGAGMMAGVEELAKEEGLDLVVVEGVDPRSLERPAFAHAKIGRNGDPASKIEEFVRLMEGELGERVDVAFFKFCYVDIDGTSDLEGLFHSYVEAMERVARRRPSVTLIHFTVPLTVVQKGPKAWIKKLLGRAPGGYLENAARNRFNEMLSERYGEGSALFDLASIEATGPGGEKEEFEMDGRRFSALFPGYTDDGGHLDEKGRRRVARELLLFLSGILEGRDER